MEYLLVFSQEDEDLILYHVLHGIDNIKWIDVGANDPIHGSVTKFFSLRGGAGINIEPHHSCCDKLKNDRQNDITLELGISNENGSMILYGREGGQSASFIHKNGINMGAKPRIVEVSTLKAVCDKYLKKSDTVHFLKIDVEGMERQVLEGMDFKYVLPWVLCIESSNPWDKGKLKNEDWERIVLDAGYQFVMQEGVNRYYVSNEHTDLKEKFKKRDELRKIYNVTRYSDNKFIETYENAIANFKQSILMVPFKMVYVVLRNLIGK